MICQLSQVLLITLTLLFCAGEARRLRHSQGIFAGYEEPSFLAISTDSVKTDCAAGCGFTYNFTNFTNRRNNRTSLLEDEARPKTKKDKGYKSVLLEEPELLEVPFNGTNNTYNSVYNITNIRNNRTALLEEEPQLLETPFNSTNNTYYSVNLTSSRNRTALLEEESHLLEEDRPDKIKKGKSNRPPALLEPELLEVPFNGSNSTSYSFYNITSVRNNRTALLEESGFLEVPFNGSNTTYYSANITSARNRTALLESLLEEEGEPELLEIFNNRIKNILKRNALLEAPINSTNSTYYSLYNVTSVRNNRTSLLEEEKEPQLLEVPFNGTNNTYNSVYNITNIRSNRTALLEEEEPEFLEKPSVNKKDKKESLIKKNL